MSKLFNAVNTKNARTENGMVAHSTSLNGCVDLFFAAGSARNYDISPKFLAAFGENPEVAVRIMQWTRDARGGAGERQSFERMLITLSKQDEELTRKVIAKIPELGRWKDILALVKNITYREQIVSMVEKALKSGDALCAKWMPRKGEIAVMLREGMGYTPKQYRKTLVNLTKVVESQMCAKEFDKIEFSHVPSVAAGRYQKAFKRNAESEYENYLSKLAKGEAKINAGAVYPYDVIRSLHNGSQRASDAQWAALPNYMEGAENHRILPMVDVSGSMTCPASGSVTAMDVAVSLGLYISERNEGKFKDEFLTFSSQPSLVKVTGDTLSSRYRQMSTSNWGMSTNLEKAFAIILTAAKGAKVKQKHMPTMILILSDMQFNYCVTEPNATAYEMIAKKYEDAGYKLPKVVFWNLNTHNADSVPVQFDERGTAMVSGFSPSIMTSILAGDNFTPEGIMLKTVMVDRYAV